MTKGVSKFMEKAFNKILRVAMLIFSILIALASAISAIVVAINIKLPVEKSSFPVFILNIFLVFFSFYGIYIFYKKRSILKAKLEKIHTGKLLLAAILLGFILRLLWIFSVPTVPTSDFAMMFEGGKDVLAGEYYIFKGTSYFARFAHDIITVMYFAFFYKISESPLILIKIFNVLFQTLSIYSMYLLVKELYSEKEGTIAALLLAIFPPFIMYCSETMSENMAIPLYILSCYFFIKSLNKSFGNIIISGTLLSIASMFRKVGEVFLIAYILYLIIYKIKEKPVKVVLSSITMIVTFIIPMYIASSILLSNGIIENHIWNSKEPNITSVLKGTNFESHGGWNSEDAALPEHCDYDYDKINSEAKKIIKERLTKSSPFELVKHYTVKLFGQWSMGDFDASSWTISNATDNTISIGIKKLFRSFFVLSGLFYSMLLILTYGGVKTKGSFKDHRLNLFYILLGGFVLLYTISEMQGRYSFVLSWVFVIFAIEGIKGGLKWSK